MSEKLNRIHRHLERANEHVRSAEQEAREAGDDSGAKDLGNLGDAVEKQRDKFNPGKR